MQVARTKLTDCVLYRPATMLQSSAMAFPALPVSDKDTEDVHLLGIFHFIMAGLGVIGILFLFFHYAMMSMVMNNPQIQQQMRQQQNGQALPFDPQLFFHWFRWFYVLVGAWGVVSIVLNLVAGFMLRGFTGRMFIFVVACINCINLPFGTVLGIFTLIVLTRDSVRLRFASMAGAR
jgi:hypothetical protein